MGSVDGVKEALEKLTTTMEKMRATQETMQASLDKWAPLTPLADQPAAIPSKVVALHSATLDRLCDASEWRVAAAVRL
jgi:response regulator of citrate/malate metabolism